MNYFKNADGHVFAYESLDVEIPVGLKPITEAEADAIRFPAPTVAQRAQAEILALEAQVTQRRLREAVLGIDNGWLQHIDDQIASLRELL